MHPELEREVILNFVNVLGLLATTSSMTSLNIGIYQVHTVCSLYMGMQTMLETLWPLHAF